MLANFVVVTPQSEVLNEVVDDEEPRSEKKSTRKRTATQPFNFDNISTSNQPPRKKSAASSNTSNKSSEKKLTPLPIQNMPKPPLVSMTTALSPPNLSLLGFNGSAPFGSSSTINLNKSILELTNKVENGFKDVNFQLTQKSVSNQLLEEEKLKLATVETSLAAEKLKTKEIFNEQLQNTLSLQLLNDNRERINHETLMKQKKAEADLEIYRARSLAEVKYQDPHLAEKERHKMKMDELRASTECQVKLAEISNRCNINAAIMNSSAFSRVPNNSSSATSSSSEYVDDYEFDLMDSNK